MGRRLPLYLALLVALFVGVVPLRECWASEAGGQGVVAAGTHSHADSHDGCEASPPCDCGCDHDADHAPAHDGQVCCIDSPFDVVASVTVVSADRSLDAAACAAVLSLAETPFLDPATVTGAHSPAPPDIREPLPTGLLSTVLLR